MNLEEWEPAWTMVSDSDEEGQEGEKEVAGVKPPSMASKLDPRANRARVSAQYVQQQCSWEEASNQRPSPKAPEKSSARRSPGPHRDSAPNKGTADETGGAAPVLPPRCQTKGRNKLTGDGGLLALERSVDPSMNLAKEIYAQLIIFKWKWFLWGLRVRAAIVDSEGRRGYQFRNPRAWAKMLGRQVGSLFGQLGAAAQYVGGDKGPELWQ